MGKFTNARATGLKRLVELKRFEPLSDVMAGLLFGLGLGLVSSVVFEEKSVVWPGVTLTSFSLALVFWHKKVLARMGTRKMAVVGFATLLAVSPLVGFLLPEAKILRVGAPIGTGSVDPDEENRQNQRALQNEQLLTFDIEGDVTEIESLGGRNFHLVRYNVPLAPGHKYGSKASGAITFAGQTGLLVQGDGSLLKFVRKKGPSPALRLESMPSNLETLLDPSIGLANSMSVRGIATGDGKIWLSFTENVAEPGASSCFGTSVVVAELPNLTAPEGLVFRPFYQSKSCYSGSADSPFQTGGGLLFVENARFAGNRDVLLLATGGNYQDPRAAQDMDSLLGAVVFFDLAENSEASASPPVALAIGLRNPQSLTYNGSEVCLTEQGPSGGDEINCFAPDLAAVTNFGWPISSYGENYGGEIVPFAPTLPSHEDFGFTEPMYFWPDSSVAPSTIVPSPWSGLPGYVVGTLGSSTEKGARSLNFFAPATYGDQDRLELIDRLLVGERIRSISSNGSEDMVWMLDDSGALWGVGY